MDKNLKNAVKKQIKQGTPLKIQKFYESVSGWKILLVIDIILSWLLDKVFHINPSVSLLDIIPEKNEDKLSFWKEFLLCFVIGLAFLLYFYITQKYFND